MKTDQQVLTEIFDRAGIPWEETEDGIVVKAARAEGDNEEEFDEFYPDLAIGFSKDGVLSGIQLF